jgi:hypothetical protein
VGTIGFAQQYSVESMPAWRKLDQLRLRSSRFAASAETPRQTLFISGDNVFAQAATGGGWATTIYLTNLGSTRQNGYLDFWTPTGDTWSFPSVQGRGDRITLSIAAGSTIIIESDDRGSLEQGWISLTRETAEGTNLVGAAVFRQRVPGRPDFEATVPLTSYFDRRVVMLFDNTAGFTTAGALVNTSLAPMSVPCTVRDVNGQNLETVNITIPDFGQAVFVFPDRFPASRNIRGSVICAAPTADLSALGLRFNSAGAFTSFPPMANLTMRQ